MLGGELRISKQIEHPPSGPALTLTTGAASISPRRQAMLSEEGIHVIPINDFREHRAASDCWCNPTADEEEPSVIIHHALDKREFTIEKGITQ
jgi:hypothetical protein